MSENPTYYECGTCKSLHRASFHCTSHTPRWKRDELDRQFGVGEWREIPESEVVAWRKERYERQAAR